MMMLMFVGDLSLSGNTFSYLCQCRQRSLTDDNCPTKAGGCVGWPNSMTSFYGNIFFLVKWIRAIFLCGFIRIRWVGWKITIKALELASSSLSSFWCLKGNWIFVRSIFCWIVCENRRQNKISTELLYHT